MATRFHPLFSKTDPPLAASTCATLMAVLSVALPLVVLLHASLVPGAWRAATSYTLEHYRALLANPTILKVALNTLTVSLAATAFATALGTFLAWLTTRTDMPLANFLQPLNLVPFYLSPLTGAIAWIYLAAPRVGFLNGIAHFLGLPGIRFNIYGLGGMIWVLGLFFTPEIYLLTSASLRRMDPTLEESARVHGSSLSTTTWRVTLALARPAILSPVVLVLISTLGEFSIPVTLGTPVGQDVLVTWIYAAMEQLPPNHSLASASSILIIAPTFLLVLAQRALLKGRSYAVVSGRGWRPARIRLGGWRYLALAFNLLYLLAAVGLPLAALAAVALSEMWTARIEPSRFTLHNLRYVLFDYPLTWLALRNSLLLAATAASVAIALGFGTAYFLHRSRTSLRHFADFIVSLPIAIPGVVLALGILIAYLRTPLYATLMILLIAYVTRFLPYAHRAAESGLLALSRDLEDASRISGAPWWCTLRRVTLPLAQPALAGAWLLLFIIYVSDVPPPGPRRHRDSVRRALRSPPPSACPYDCVVRAPTGRSSAHCRLFYPPSPCRRVADFHG